MSAKARDLTGMRFGRLLVISRAYTDDKTHAYWLCKCDCGKEKIVCGSGMFRGAISSCGCYAKEKATKHGMKNALIYKAWCQMKQRCENPRNAHYNNYGGRGITVCKRWHDFVLFYEDMGDRPRGKTLDRIDNNKGYFKENCRWATRQQENNRRNNRNITIDGVTSTLKLWAEKFGINYNTVFKRLENGWDEKEALTKKVNKKYATR